MEEWIEYVFSCRGGYMYYNNNFIQLSYLGNKCVLSQVLNQMLGVEMKCQGLVFQEFVQ